MDPLHFIDSEKVSVQTATAAGSFVALMVTRKYGWAHALTLLAVGQVTAFYWTLPICQAFNWGMAWYGPVGFANGAVGMLIWGGIVSLAQNLSDDPKGTLSWGWRLWKGEANVSDDDIPPGN